MVLFMVLMACSGVKEQADTGGSGGLDSGPIQDTETGEPGETGESGETGGAGDGEPDLIFEVSGATAGLGLSLFWLDPSSLSSGAPALGEALASVRAEASTALDLPPPPESALVVVDPSNAPGLSAAFYVPGLFEDADGDGAPGADEPWTGVGLVWPVYLSGPLPTDMLMQGFSEGWNALRFTSGSAEPEILDPLAIPISQNQLPTETLTLGGAWTGAVGPEGYGLFAAPYPLFFGEAVDAFLADGPASAGWSMTFSGAPPEDHLAILDFLGVEGGLEVPLAYADADGSGSFTAGDAPVFAACLDGAPVGALWLPPPTDLSLALTLSMQGLAPGWLALYVGEAEGLPDPTRLDALEAGEACAIE